MNSNWTTFISEQGAIQIDSCTMHFGDPSAEIQASTDSAIIADLQHVSLIKIGGKDAETFLHNQITNDLKALALHHNQLSAYCNPKGRVLALFQITRLSSDSFLLALPQEIAETTLKRLKMFVMRSEVVFEDMTDSWCHIGLAGPKSIELMQACDINLPENINTAVEHQKLLIISLPGPSARFRLMGPADDIQSLWQSLNQQAQPAGQQAWEYQDIAAGIPTLHKDTVESFVPQMINLEAAQGLSFTKGCYPGQEVVARMQYLGKLKRRMYRAQAMTNTCPAAGDLIYIEDNGDERKAGEIVASQPISHEKIELLAVLEIAATENSTLRIKSNQAPVIELLALPYENNT